MSIHLKNKNMQKKLNAYKIKSIIWRQQFNKRAMKSLFLKIKINCKS